MSHYLAGVVVPLQSRRTWKELDAAVAAALARYDENLELPEYETECYCVGLAARLRAGDAARERMGTFVSPIPDKHPFDLEGEERRSWERAAALWERRFTAQVTEILKDDPEATSPDPDCEECGGTGKERTTRNPAAKWDWYEVGGRWDERLGEPGLPDNTIRVSTLLDRPTFLELLPRALVLDGEWHEKGRMGWFGMSSGDQTPEEWATHARSLLEPFRDRLLVAVDLHI